MFDKLFTPITIKDMTLLCTGLEAHPRRQARLPYPHGIQCL